MDIITRLEATRDRTLAHFDRSAEQLAQSYAPGKWPVRYLLHHLADAETVLFDRIRRIISEPRQVLWAFDQDAWAKGLGYSRIPLDLSRRIFESVRAGVIYQARLHYESSGQLANHDTRADLSADWSFGHHRVHRLDQLTYSSTGQSTHSRSTNLDLSLRSRLAGRERDCGTRSTAGLRQYFQVP